MYLWRIDQIDQAPTSAQKRAKSSKKSNNHNPVSVIWIFGMTLIFLSSKAVVINFRWKFVDQNRTIIHILTTQKARDKNASGFCNL